MSPSTLSFHKMRRVDSFSHHPWPWPTIQGDEGNYFPSILWELQSNPTRGMMTFFSAHNLWRHLARSRARAY